MDVINRLDELGINHLPIAERMGIENIQQLIEDISNQITLSHKNILVKDILNKAQG